MADSTRELFGSTSMQGSIPGACACGPVFHEDGRLILNESFIALTPRKEANLLLEQFRNDWLVEAWRIWDCGERTWAACDITLYRLESIDVVVRDAGSAGVCVWAGALDVRSRVLASLDPDENAACWWQWLRNEDVRALPAL